MIPKARLDARGVLAVLVTAGILLAGCAGDDLDDAQPQAAADGNEGGNQTAPVEAVISVSFNGTALQEVNGTLASSVGANLTFDASGSVGTNLSYEWDFGDGATADNQTAVHAYASSGVFNVTLAVSDEASTATANVVLNVTALGPAPGDAIGSDHHEFSGTVLVGNPNSANFEDVDHVNHLVPIGAADPNGTAGVAQTALLTLDASSAGGLIMYVYWISPEGTTLASTDTDTGEATLLYEEAMPPGDYVLRIRLFAGAQASYTATADVGYVAA